MQNADCPITTLSVEVLHMIFHFVPVSPRQLLEVSKVNRQFRYAVQSHMAWRDMCTRLAVTPLEGENPMQTILRTTTRVCYSCADEPDEGLVKVVAEDIEERACSKCADRFSSVVRFQELRVEFARLGIDKVPKGINKDILTFVYTGVGDPADIAKRYIVEEPRRERFWREMAVHQLPRIEELEKRFTLLELYQHYASTGEHWYAAKWFIHGRNSHCIATLQRHQLFSQAYLQYGPEAFGASLGELQQLNAWNRYLHHDAETLTSVLRIMQRYRPTPTAEDQRRSLLESHLSQRDIAIDSDNVFVKAFVEQGQGHVTDIAEYIIELDWLLKNTDMVNRFQSSSFVVDDEEIDLAHVVAEFCQSKMAAVMNGLESDLEQFLNNRVPSSLSYECDEGMKSLFASYCVKGAKEIVESGETFESLDACLTKMLPDPDALQCIKFFLRRPNLEVPDAPMHEIVENIGYAIYAMKSRALGQLYRE